MAIERKVYAGDSSEFGYLSTSTGCGMQNAFGFALSLAFHHQP